MRLSPTKRLKILSSIAFFVVALYVAVSAYVASTLWQPVRRPLHTTPAQYGLKYEDVQFTSAGDNITLKGWFMDSPGTSTILVMHGSRSARDNFINMEVSRVLAQHGYDV